MANRRAAFTEAEVRRACKVAEEFGCVAVIDLPDGRRWRFEKPGKPVEASKPGEWEDLE